MNEVGTIYSKTYTHLRTTSVTEASKYFLLRKHKIAIPAHSTSQDSYSVLATYLGDWSLPELLSELPSCSPDLLTLLTEADPSWTILPVLVHVLVVQPIETLSPSQLDVIRETKKRNAAEQKKKYYPVGKLDLS